jgi:15-cis-phytoene synthase
MTTSAAFAACEDVVRRHDPDRYFAALFAPEDKRRHLFALYAFYYELVHVAHVVREPLLADIRLAWWRETVEGARAGNPRDHDVARALTDTLAVHDLPAPLFERMIEARSFNSGPDAFADTTAVEAYADATTGNLMRLAARVLCGAQDVLARESGLAYALAGRHSDKLAAVEGDLPRLAREHLAAARRLAMPEEALPAFLPAALVPLYLKRSAPPLWRKQIALYWAAKRGRI